MSALLNFVRIIVLFIIINQYHIGGRRSRLKRKIHYGWIVLGVAFLGVLAAQGLRYSFGAFMSPWEEDFTASRGLISAVSFVSFAVFAISQPIVGKLIDRFGIKNIFIYSVIVLGISTLLTYFATSVWQLFILYGVISSLGFGGASGVTATLAVTKWFHKKQGLALGIVEAGFGAGQMIIVPSSLLLIDQFGWRVTTLWLGGFLLLVVFPILAFFLKSEPSDVGLSPLGKEAEVEEDEKAKAEALNQPVVSRKSFVNQRAFWFLIIPYFICGVTTTGLMDTHLIPFAQACGFSVGLTGLAVSFLALFNTLGTVVAGVLSDRLDNRKMVAIIYLVRGTTILFLLFFTLNSKWLGIFLENSWLLIVFSVAFGIVDFAVVAPTMKLMAGYFHGPSIGVITGFIYMSHQLGSAIGSFFPGILFDTTGSYTVTFAIASALLILASILSYSLPRTSTI
jgi:sugar phosphate permease